MKRFRPLPSGKKS